MITIYLKQYNKIIRNADTGLFEELGYDDILWIDMLQPTIKEQKAVENFMEINLQTKQQVEEIESTSKYSETENAIISNANFFVPTGESFVIEPVSFIISNEVCWFRCARPSRGRFRRRRSGSRSTTATIQRAIIFSSRCSKCGSTTMLTWSS